MLVFLGYTLAFSDVNILRCVHKHCPLVTGWVNVTCQGYQTWRPQVTFHWHQTKSLIWHSPWALGISQKRWCLQVIWTSQVRNMMNNVTGLARLHWEHQCLQVIICATGLISAFGSLVGDTLKLGYRNSLHINNKGFWVSSLNTFVDVGGEILAKLCDGSKM